MSLRELAALNREVVGCARCPRLVRWRQAVAREKRAAFAHETYWGRPVPTRGRADARLWIVGLAPAAHRANRTGRMFTGDRSAAFLFEALHATGFASAPSSERADDGTELIDAVMSAVVRCAPPANRPEPGEIASCRPYLEREAALLGRVRVVLALGALAHRAACDLLLPGSRPRFAHGLELTTKGPTLLASYHPSQQNTFTRRLTQPMLRDLLARARALLDAS